MYLNLEMLKKSARLVKSWNLSEFDDYIMLSKSGDIHRMAKFEVYIEAKRKIKPFLLPYESIDTFVLNGW